MKKHRLAWTLAGNQRLFRQMRNQEPKMQTPWPRKSTLIATAFALATSWTGLAPAQDVRQSSTIELLAAKKKTKSTKLGNRIRAGVPNQIACTRTGCHPIPRDCHPEIEYDFWGRMTGFDAVVCR